MKTSSILLGFVVATSICLPSCKTTHPFVDYANQHSVDQASTKDQDFVSSLESGAKPYLDAHGRVTPELQSALYEVEHRYYDHLDAQAQTRFQAFLASIGGKLISPQKMPESSVPFWLVEKGPLDGYRSHTSVPKHADIVIIGAGLTGASAAYHLAEEAKKGRTVLVIEAEKGPARVSSGRNGGNFQLLPENYVGSYEGMVEERIKVLRIKRPELSPKARAELAEKEAKILVNFSAQNFQRFRDLVSREGIDCDFSEQGWLRIASSAKEEEALIKDTHWLNALNDSRLPKNELWTAKTIQEKLGIPAKFSGRYIAKNGNYHPFKYVTAVLENAIGKGVQFYTNLPVQKVEQTGKFIRVKTPEGDILTHKVIVATNSQTPRLFPELDRRIITYPSQIINMEHVEDSLQGMTVTEQGGDIYYNMPKSKQYVGLDGKKRGMLHFGEDLPIVKEGESQSVSRDENHFARMKTLIDERFPTTKAQPASRVWVGPMAFTNDRVPVIGFLRSKNIVIAAAFQGYGGSYCTEAGYVAAQMALTGKVHQEVPKELFSPERFLTKQELVD